VGLSSVFDRPVSRAETPPCVQNGGQTHLIRESISDLIGNHCAGSAASLHPDYGCHFFLDISPYYSYITILAPVKDMARRHTASWERGRCPRVDLQSAPGRLGYQPPGIMTGVGGASLDWDRRRRVTPVQTTSQEAWPEAEPLGWNTPSGESRGGTPSSVRAPKGRAPHRKMRRLVTLRLPAFRFLQLILEVLIRRSSTDERKAGTTPGFPGPDRFRA
jgi:hypothetical protein